MNPSIQQIYGNHLRIRACGICIENDSLLLINHQGLTPGDFWAPPGGGINFGESATECIAREFLEETGLVVKVSDFLFVYEFINQPLHAVELFFEVKRIGGELKIGNDPESGGYQIIESVKFMDQKQIEMVPRNHLHGIFSKVEKIDKILHLRGYFKS